MNSHQIIFIQFSNNEGSKSQQFLGGGWRHLNDHVWKRSPGHDTNDVIMGGFDAHSSTLDILFRQITTFIKVHSAFVFGLQTL